MRFTTGLGIALAIVSLGVVSVLANYDGLNDYLVGKVSDNDVESNMKAALDLLEQLGIQGNSISPTIPIADLKRFVALQQVRDDSKCDRTAHEIMRLNGDTVHMYRLNPDEVSRRVDQVILKIFEDHAKRCQAVYPVTYRAMRDQLDQVMLERVEALTGTLMEKDRFAHDERFYTPESLFFQYIKYPISLRNYIGEDILRAALISSAKDDPNVKYTHKVPDERTGKGLVIYRDRLRNLVRNYLIEPCKKFTEHLGPDLFNPARFDVRYNSQLDDTNAEFYLGWSRYRICEILAVKESTVFTDVLDSIPN